VGAFESALVPGSTTARGQVESAVTPSRIPVEVMSAGPCALLEPPVLFCDPECDLTQEVCTGEGTCAPRAVGLDVGAVTVYGLEVDPIELSNNGAPFRYDHRETLSAAAFAEGDPIVFAASGGHEVGAFALGATGVAQVQSSVDAVALEPGQQVSLSWTPPSDAGTSQVHIDLNIAQHGGTAGRIECTVADSGAFDLPLELTDTLLSRGFSGFPTLTLTRFSVDSVTQSIGCIELRVESSETIDVSIPGLSSCRDPMDCPDGQTCQADLTCG
jgi:hypothetical protein